MKIASNYVKLERERESFIDNKLYESDASVNGEVNFEP